MFRNYRHLIFSFAVSILVFIGAGVVGCRAVETLVQDNQSRVMARLVAINIQMLLSWTTQAETGQRGFVITGKEEYLQPYHDAKQKLPLTLAYLKEALAHDAAEMARLNVIEILQKKKFEELDETINVRRQYGFDAAQAIVLSDRGKALMDEIRKTVHAIERVETVQLEKRIARSGESADQAYLTLILTSLVGVGLLIFLTFVVRADARARQKALQQIASGRALLDNIIDNSPATIYLVDAAGKLIIANKATQDFFGVTRSKLIGKTLADVMPRPDADVQEEQHRLALQNGSAVIFEEVANLPTGARHFLTSRVPIYDDHGGLIGVCSVSSDISLLKKVEDEVRALNQTLENRVAERTHELAKANAELHDANSNLEAFSYTVAHDLRAPLRGIHGFAEAIREDYEVTLDQLAQDYLRRISRAAARMQQLIDDLLAFSLLARTELPLEKIRLQEVVGETLSNLDAYIKENQATIKVSEHSPVVIGNWSACLQALQNLVANAIKFSHTGRPAQIEIDIETIRSPVDDPGHGTVRISVSDHGIGIPQQHLGKIFLPFERLHGVEEYAGTGIGLAIVAKAASRMHGTCGVESNVHQGSRFWVELPAACA